MIALMPPAALGAVTKLFAEQCDGDCLKCALPVEKDHTFPDGIFVKMMEPIKAGIYLAQHAHKYDHTTLVCSGGVRMWHGPMDMGDYPAGSSIFIRAGIRHTFLSLQDDTRLACIHNVSRSGAVEIKE